MRDLLKERGIRTRLVDLSTSGKPSAADVPPTEIALNHRRGAGGVFTGDRGRSVAGMARGLRDLDSPPERHRRHHFRRRLGRHLDRDAGDARAAARRAEDHDLDRRLRRRAVAMSGPCDIMMMYSVTDVQGLNAISRQVLANGAQAMAGMVKARLAQDGKSRSRRTARTGIAGGRTDHVRRHDAVRAADHGFAQERLRLPGVSRHRRRRPVDGEADRFRHARRRHRRHHDRSLRPADGRRAAGDRGPLRRRHPRAHALCRLVRRARHGQFRRRATPCPATTRAGCSTSTIRRSR